MKDEMVAARTPAPIQCLMSLVGAAHGVGCARSSRLAACSSRLRRDSLSTRCSDTAFHQERLFPCVLSMLALGALGPVSNAQGTVAARFDQAAVSKDIGACAEGTRGRCRGEPVGGRRQRQGLVRVARRPAFRDGQCDQNLLPCSTIRRHIEGNSTTPLPGADARP